MHVNMSTEEEAKKTGANRGGIMTGDKEDQKPKAEESFEDQTNRKS